MTIYLSFNRATTAFAERTAIIQGEKQFTYREFGERVERLAHYLHRIGMAKESVVAVLAPNTHEVMELYYACACTGIVLNPLNYRLAPKEISKILADSGAKVLFLHPDFSAMAEQFASGTAELERIVWLSDEPQVSLAHPTSKYEQCISACEPLSLPTVPIESDDLAYLYYTSGTTGEAKGVMLTQNNVASNALGAVAELNLTDADTWLHIAPIFHLADAWSIFAVTWAGGTHILVPYFSTEEFFKACERDRASICVLVPTMVNAVLGDEKLSSRDCSSMKRVMTAGSPIAPEQVRKLTRSIDCEYIQFYGMTETSPFLTISTTPSYLNNLPEEKLFELRCKTGRPFINVEVRVVRPDGNSVEPDEQEVGEIVAKGPVVMKGYFKRQDLTDKTIENGWIHTGDLAVIDKYGFINIVDRQKDMIITGGENVYSTEVEYALYEHEAVRECAVFGVPHQQWGETVHAAVVLKDGANATQEQLIEFVRQRLAKYKSPRAIDFLNELPKTGSGKISKKTLRDSHWKDQSKKVH